MSKPKIHINDRAIGEGEPVFVIAEAGVNHNGDLSRALELVDVAAEANADAVKFQTFVSEKVISPLADKAEYQKVSTGNEESQLDMVKRLELSFADFRKIKAHCDARNITFLSTPFDEPSVAFLHSLNIPAFKVSSGDLTNYPFLRTIAATHRPVILSTGMSNLSEVEEAVQVICNAGQEELALLQCVTNYPAAAEDVNLRAMDTMRERFHVPVGYSDHTLGIEIALAATALGACIIEKHFTLDKTLPGPDHRASLEPGELNSMIEGIRKVESALGNGEKIPAVSELPNALIARRSLIAAVDIKEGARMASEHIAIMRPGNGMPPKLIDRVVGLTAKVNIPAGTLLTLEMFE